MVREAYTLRKDDDDYSQPRALINDVMDDGERERLVNNIVGHLCDGVCEEVLERAFQYWKNIDENIGARVEAGVRNAQ